MVALLLAHKERTVRVEFDGVCEGLNGRFG